MTGTRKRRWVALAVFALLAAALITAMGSGDDDADVTTPVVPATRAAPAQAKTDGLEDSSLRRPKRAPMQVSKEDLFRPKSWYVAPPPPPAPPPPAPKAPALPFTFLGKILGTDGKFTLVLSGNGRVYMVRKGDTIDKRYHVNGIAHGRLGFTYLPMHKKQYIEVGELP